MELADSIYPPNTGSSAGVRPQAPMGDTAQVSAAYNVGGSAGASGGSSALLLGLLVVLVLVTLHHRG